MKTQSIIKTALVAAAFSAFALVGSAQAQVITWSTPQAVDPTSESNISTMGTELDGIQGQTGYGSALTLANGVVFNDTTASGSTVSDGSGGIVITDATNYGNYTLGTNTFTDPSYNQLLHLSDVLGGSGTITFNNLTSGNTYQVEFWSAGAGAAHPEWGINLAGSTPVGLSSQVGADGPGTLVIGTFTAAGPSMTEDFSASDYGTSTDLNGLTPTNYGVDVISAVQIREIAEAPEPSTYALLGLGALALLVVSRRRKA